MGHPKIHPVGVTDRYQHTLIVAGPGFGKTVFWGTSPQVVFLTTDPEGTVSAWAMGSKSREWEINSWADMDEAYIYFRDGGLVKEGLDKPGSWIVVDNASETQSFGMAASMKGERANNAKLDEFIPTQAAYQRSQNMFLTMVRKLHDLPVNVGWTAWIKSEEDENGETYFAPAVHGQQGALAQQFAGLMNIVGYGEVIENGDQEIRRIWFTHHGPYRGKDRYIALGRKRDDLTVPKMVQIIDVAVKKRLAERAATTKPGGAPARARTATATPTKTPAVRRTRKV